MQVEIFYNYSKKIIFDYSKIIDFFSAIHVLLDPSHHLNRYDWINSILNNNELAPKIEEIKKISHGIIPLITLVSNENYRYYDIPECLNKIYSTDVKILKNIYEKYNLKVSGLEIEKILNFCMFFYEDYFKKNLHFLELLVNKIMKKESNVFIKKGLDSYLKTLHERLFVNENEIEFRKNKSYIFNLNRLNEIYITGNTFISPHLLMDYSDNKIFVYKKIDIEKRQNFLPEDTFLLFKSLGDATRLKIIKEIGNNQQSTQSLSKILKISEAGISKHLKMLYDAKILNKTRNGNYIYYSLNKDTIDFITLHLYEFIFQ